MSDLAKIDSAYFSEALEVTQVVQDKYSYSKSLIQITAYYVEPPFEISNELEFIGKEYNTYSAFFMSKICGTNPKYIEDAVNLAFKVDSDVDRELILGEIACCYSKFLRIALQHACKLSNDVDRILVLTAIVNDLPANLLTEFIDRISSLIEDDRLRQEILSELTRRKRLLKKTTDQSLGEKLQHIEALPDPISKAYALHDLLPRLPLDILPLKRCQAYLHLLDRRKRADLMGDLATLYPAILHLGGEDAGRGWGGRWEGASSGSEDGGRRTKELRMEKLEWRSQLLREGHYDDSRTRATTAHTRSNPSERRTSVVNHALSS